MKQTVVIDASLATMWAVPEPLSAEALALATRWAQEGTHLLAPSLLIAEVTNALYRRIIRGDMDLSTAMAALEIVLGFPIEIREEPGLPIRAMTLANDLKQPTTYDCHYLTLAERYQCELWTGDKGFYNTVKDAIPWVKCIG